MSLQERLDKIRTSPKLQSQQQTAVILAAIDDTLRGQNSDPTPTAYFAALLSLLPQYVSADKGIPNKDVAYAVVYLLDLVTSHVPAPLLRSKFPQILPGLAPALTHPDAEAPLLRASTGCLESLLLAQDAAAWALPQSPTSPRGAVGGLLALAVDHRPKVRKRAQDALNNVLTHPPPSPAIDHPAADMAAQTALRGLQTHAEDAENRKKGRATKGEQHNEPALMHALQLVKTVAAAERGWPSSKIDALCEVLLNISRGSNEYLTMAAFEVFEIVFAGLADELSSAKLPRLLDAIKDLQPSQNDSQLLPPWIAVLSRGYDVSAQVDPDDTFAKLPELFAMIANFLTSSSHNIRVSASECLISLLNTCLPDAVILEPSIMDDKLLERIAKTLEDLLSVKYQTAWMEVFKVLTSAFEVLRWQSHPLLVNVVKAMGDLRGNESFSGKKEADAVLSAAIHAMGPENALSVLPLNLVAPARGQPGRAWLLPLIRDSASNTSLSHFRSEMVPLSESMFQRVLNHGSAEKTMDIKVFETVVNQIWACLPGYCELPLDLTDSFDQNFAEMLSNLLYQQPHLRTDICKALQNLVDTNRSIAELETDENTIQQGRVTKVDAQRNLEHLAGFANNLLAVLFNVYSQTLPHNRGNLLQCINAFLSITPAPELMQTFQRVASMLETALAEQIAQAAEKQKDTAAPAKDAKNKMPPTSHTLMDLVITMSIYLPRECFGGLFIMAANIVNTQHDAQLQKKAYKLIPRLAESDVGRQALEERNADLQRLLLDASDKALAPARRDRLDSIAEVVPFLPTDDLHFIPSIISEVVISAKEVNEKARTAAFDLLVLMGQKMSEGGTVVNAKVPHMAPDAPSAAASLEEYFTMVSAGLAGSTPHMISASITALTRLLYEFRPRLPDATVTDLVQTMDLFLTSRNREIVRSVLGFVKVCVVSLPAPLVLPRLPTLVPNLVVWSHEHKQHFKSKVKHILERAIRRFGVDAVERCTPEADRRLIANIRKTRERRKRRRDGAAEDGDGAADEEDGGRRRGKFESEFDEAVYGSDEDGERSGDDDDGSDISDDDVLRRAVAKGQQRPDKGGRRQYIVEDEDEPLDLLDRRALAHVSSTKPVRRQPAGESGRKRAKTDVDGKLVFNDYDDDDEAGQGGHDGDEGMRFDERGMVDGREPGDGTLEGGINAYVDALKGRDAPVRGLRGKLKFKQKGGSGDDDAGDEMEIDGAEFEAARRKAAGSTRDGGPGRSPRGRGGMAGRGGMSARGGRAGRGETSGRGGRAGRGETSGRGGRAGRGQVGRPVQQRQQQQTQRRGLGVEKSRGVSAGGRGGAGPGGVRKAKSGFGTGGRGRFAGRRR